MNKQELIVTSPSFKDEEWIPRKHSARAEDVSPQLNLQGISPKGKTIAITMDDTSHPLFPNYNHWVIWNIPVQEIIPEALPHAKVLDDLGGAIQGMAYGKNRYKGPKPPFKTIHQYVFTVYVLDCSCDLGSNSKKTDLVKEMEGHIIQTARLSGKFQSYRKEG